MHNKVGEKQVTHMWKQVTHTQYLTLKKLQNHRVRGRKILFHNCSNVRINV
jgi:hypothetical protein